MRPTNESGMLKRPTQGHKALPISLEFVGVGTLAINVTDEIIATGMLDFVQGIFIDNSANAVDPCTITFQTLANKGFVIKCPAGAQLFAPINVPPGAVTFNATSAIGNTVPIELYNFPVAPACWPSATVANVTANMTPLAGAYANRNKLLTGGVDVIMAANVNRKRFYIQASPANVANVTITYASGAIVILTPGGFIDSATGPVDDTTITATGTLNDNIYAGEI